MANTVIAGIATALSPSGIGIIRMSGEGCIQIADKIFRGKKSLLEVSSHEIIYGHIFDGKTKIDEVLVTVMRAPKSYTTEDVVEINCHGGVFVIKKILELTYSNGAEPAKPGEFTMRAFLNGRIDLSQAESVMDIISSQNEMSLNNSISQLSGSYSEKIGGLREKILTEVAFIETALDDPEHFSLEEYPDKLSQVVNEVICEVSSLIDSSKDGSIIKSGIPTAIIGRVNVGKSSLLNALSGWEKAIVTDIPGTTRDVIEDSINLGEFTLRLTDTAGIRDTEDKVERIGVDKSIKLIDESELILFLIDASMPFSEEDNELLCKIKNKKAIVCLNKSDLDMAISVSDIEKLTSHKVVEISARNITGINDLKNAIKDIFFNKGLEDRADFYVTNERHKFLLEKTRKSLGLVVSGIEQLVTEDFLVIDLMDAYEALGKIIGQEIEDDVVEMIFSKFCIGK